MGLQGFQTGAKQSHTCSSQNWTVARSQFGLFYFANKTSHFVASLYRPPVDRPVIKGDTPVLDNGNDLLNVLQKFDNLF